MRLIERKRQNMENKKTRTATEKEIKAASKEVLKKHHKALENLADNGKTGR